MTNVKKNIITIVIGGIVASTALLSISQANAFERGGKRGGGQVFQALDVNQDSLLSLNEMLTPALARAETRLTTKDTDEDGVISFEEFIATKDGTKTDLSDIADEIVQCVADLKAETENENIEVPSPDQFMSLDDKFAELDTSGDGFIDLTELQDRVTEKVNDKFTMKDVDQDGFLDMGEFNKRNSSKGATRRAIRHCIAEITSDDII